MRSVEERVRRPWGNPWRLIPFCVSARVKDRVLNRSVLRSIRSVFGSVVDLIRYRR